MVSKEDFESLLEKVFSRLNLVMAEIRDAYDTYKSDLKTYLGGIVRKELHSLMSHNMQLLKA